MRRARDTGQEPPRTWRCGACDTYNEPAEPACMCCGTARASTVNVVSGEVGGDVVQARTITNIQATSIGRSAVVNGPVRVEEGGLWL